MNTGGKFYILDKDRKVIETDIHTWAEWISKPENKIVIQELMNGYQISTCFLGIDHSYTRNGLLEIFETMIFKIDENGERNGDVGYQERCSTWEQALEMHLRGVDHTMTPEMDLGNPWDKAPTDMVFDDMKKAATDIWKTYDNTYGYVDEKLEIVNAVKNIENGAMRFYQMFDHTNKRKMMEKLCIESKRYIKANINDNTGN